VVEDDPRIQISEADRKAWYDMQMAMSRVNPQLQQGMRTLNTLGNQLREVKTQIGRNPRTPDAVTKALQALLDKVEGLGGREPESEPPGFAGAPLADAPQTIQSRIGFGGGGGFGGGMTGAPTAAQKAALERNQKELAAFAETMRGITDTDVPALNKLLLEAGVGRINLQAGDLGGAGRRPPEGDDPR
jgi:ABC-type transporter Mla subunit MlaD